MNKRVVAVVVALVLVVGGVGGALALSRMSPSMDGGSNPSAPVTGGGSDGGAGTPASSGGTYTDYSETAIANADGRILLFFHAPWCPQCRTIDSDIQSQGVPDGVTIIKVDYDSHQDLRQKYDVTIQTSFVEVDNSGKSKQLYVAYDEPRLDTVLAAML